MPAPAACFAPSPVPTKPSLLHFTTLPCFAPPPQDLSHNRLMIDIFEEPMMRLSLSDAASLRHLVLDDADLLVWPPGLSALSALTFLDLRKLNSDPLEDPAADVRLPPRLEHLVVSGRQCPCGDCIPPQELPKLRHLTTLRHLAAAYCEPAQLLAALPLMGRLTCLNLSLVNLSGQTLRVSGQGLCPWAGLCMAAWRLRRLLVAWCDVPWAGLQHCAATWLPACLPACPSQVYHCRHLESLTLHSCSLSAWPQGVKDCHALSCLDLSCNPQLGSKPRVTLAGLTRLCSLALAGCGLSRLPAGLPRLERLGELDVRRNCIATTQAEDKWLAGRFAMPPADAEAHVCEGWVYRCRVG